MSNYIVKRADRARESDLAVGDEVYEFNGNDYGLSGEDTHETGLKHICVSLNPTGVPFFTIPRQDLRYVD